MIDPQGKVYTNLKGRYRYSRQSAVDKILSSLGTSDGRNLRTSTRIRMGLVTKFTGGIFLPIVSEVCEESA